MRLDAKRKALDTLAKEEVNAKEGIQTGVTSHRTSQIRILSLCHSPKLAEKNGGDDGTRDISPLSILATYSILVPIKTSKQVKTPNPGTKKVHSPLTKVNRLIRWIGPHCGCHRMASILGSIESVKVAEYGSHRWAAITFLAFRGRTAQLRASRQFLFPGRTALGALGIQMTAVREPMAASARMTARRTTMRTCSEIAQPLWVQAKDCCCGFSESSPPLIVG